MNCKLQKDEGGPVCGEKMKYLGITTNKKTRVYQCPVCDGPGELKLKEEK